MGQIGPLQIVILLVIVLIIFGPKNLPRLAQSIGQSVRELKKGLQGLGDDINNDSARSGSDTKPNPADRSTGDSEARPVERNGDSGKHKSA